MNAKKLVKATNIVGMVAVLDADVLGVCSDFIECFRT